MSSPMEGYMFDVRPTRVSLVKRPANKREFLITKNQEVTPMDEVIQVITETQAENEESLVEALKSAEKDAGTTQAAVAVARVLAAFRDSLTESDLDEIAKSLAFKVAEEEVAEEEAVAEEEVEEEVVEEETVEEAPADAEPAEVTASEEAVAEEVVDEPKEDKVNEDLSALKAEVEALKAERELSKFKEMVEDLTLTKTSDEIAPILQSVAKSAGEEALESILELLRAASSVSKIAFEEVGSAAPGRVYKSDAWAKIEDVAKQIMKDEGVAFERAVEFAVERNPELGREYYNN